LSCSDRLLRLRLRLLLFLLGLSLCLLQCLLIPLLFLPRERVLQDDLSRHGLRALSAIELKKKLILIQALLSAEHLGMLPVPIQIRTLLL